MDNPYDGSMRERILALKNGNELSATGHLGLLFAVPIESWSIISVTYATGSR
jgi:hypothetical protein